MKRTLLLLLALPCLAFAATTEERVTDIESFICDTHGAFCPVIEEPAPVDSDGDGVNDDVDQCPNTSAGATVDAVGCEVVTEPPPPPPSGHPLSSATVNEWTEIPNSALNSVMPAEAFEQPIRYMVGPSALATAWSGASWNDAAQEMHFIAGGGHADYCGNQHLKFDLDTLVPTLVRPPSSLGTMTYTELGDAGQTPDGNPNSRHTYAGTVFDSSRNVHYLFPGSSCDPAGDSDNNVWQADNDTGVTQKLMGVDYPLMGSLGWRGSRNLAFFDSMKNETWASNMGFFYKFNPDTGKRTAYQTNGAQFAYGFKQGVAFDVDRRTALLTGGGSFWTYNVDTDSLVRYLDKGAEFKECYGPGIDFIESMDRYAVWCGGNDIYLVNPDDFSVSTVTATGTAPIKPGSGMHGKMRWSEKYGGLLFITSSEANANFVKL